MKAKATNLHLSNQSAIDEALRSFHEELSRLLDIKFYGSVELIVHVEGGMIQFHKVNTSQRRNHC